MNQELVRLGRQAIKHHFLGYKTPQLELPADSVIDAAVEDIVRMTTTIIKEHMVNDISYLMSEKQFEKVMDEFYEKLSVMML